MRFSSGMAGAAIVTLALIGSIFAGLVLNVDSHTEQRNIYDPITDITSLYGGGDVLGSSEYNTAQNWTGWSNIDFTPATSSNYVYTEEPYDDTPYTVTLTSATSGVSAMTYSSSSTGGGPGQNETQTINTYAIYYKASAGAAYTGLDADAPGESLYTLTGTAMLSALSINATDYATVTIDPATGPIVVMSSYYKTTTSKVTTTTLLGTKLTTVTNSTFYAVGEGATRTASNIIAPTSLVYDASTEMITAYNGDTLLWTSNSTGATLIFGAGRDNVTASVTKHIHPPSQFMDIRDGVSLSYTVEPAQIYDPDDTANIGTALTANGGINYASTYGVMVPYGTLTRYNQTPTVTEGVRDNIVQTTYSQSPTVTGIADNGYAAWSDTNGLALVGRSSVQTDDTGFGDFYVYTYLPDTHVLDVQEIQGGTPADGYQVALDGSAIGCYVERVNVSNTTVVRVHAIYPTDSTHISTWNQGYVDMTAHSDHVDNGTWVPSVNVNYYPDGISTRPYTIPVSTLTTSTSQQTIGQTAPRVTVSPTNGMILMGASAYAEMFAGDAETQISVNNGTVQLTQIMVPSSVQLWSQTVTLPAGSVGACIVSEGASGIAAYPVIPQNYLHQSTWTYYIDNATRYQLTPAEDYGSLVFQQDGYSMIYQAPVSSIVPTTSQVPNLVNITVNNVAYTAYANSNTLTILQGVNTYTETIGAPDYVMLCLPMTNTSDVTAYQVTMSGSAVSSIGSPVTLTIPGIEAAAISGFTTDAVYVRALTYNNQNQTEDVPAVATWSNSYINNRLSILVKTRELSATNALQIAAYSSNDTQMASVHLTKVGTQVIVSGDMSYTFGNWSGILITFDTEAGTITANPVANLNIFTQYKVDDFSYTVAAASLTSPIDHLQVSGIAHVAFGVVSTWVPTDAYGVLKQDPYLNIADYYPSLMQDGVQVKLSDFARYGDSITVNGVTFDVDTLGKTVVHYDARDRSVSVDGIEIRFANGNTTVVFEPDGSSPVTLDLGNTTTTTIYLSGLWAFTSDVAQSKMISVDVHEWEAGDITEIVAPATMAIFLVLEFIVAMIIQRSRGLTLADWAILAFGAALAFIIMGMSL